MIPIKRPAILVLTIVPVLIGVIIGVPSVSTCRVASDKLTNYVTHRIERWLDPKTLSLLYWTDEPLDEKVLSRATGLNVTLAETKFDIAGSQGIQQNEVIGKDYKFIEDLFLACSAERGRQNVIAINLELDNPFKKIDIHYMPDNSSAPNTFYLNLQQSSFLIQLTQQMNFEECIHINFVQLTSNVEYSIECPECNEHDLKQLDRMFKKRITHIDAELCNLLSDKLMYGLRNLLDQERLELEINM